MNKPNEPDLTDEFPDTPARRAVVSVVRGFGAVARQMGPHYASFGLTPPQFQMLTVLNRLRSEEVTQRRLGKELYVSFPNVTVMLSRLEKTGLIERIVNGKDHRERLVKITAQGRSLLKKIWKTQPDQLERVTVGLTDDERLQLARLMNKMIDGPSSQAVDDS
jgi:MarR family 2-MHQ and catechol resistance regulon transcriptional repressor